jgi:hypothetical protein
MRCKYCGEEIKPSGELWILDATLGEKADIVRMNGWSLNDYRAHAILCGYTDRPHEPDESSKVKQILSNYESRTSLARLPRRRGY